MEEIRGSLNLQEELTVHNLKNEQFTIGENMNEQRYLIDIERFVKWTYNNPRLFNGESAVFSKSAVKEWRRYESLPSKK